MTDVKEHGDPAPGAAPAPPGDLRARLRGLAVPICLGVVTGLGAQFAISALLGNMGGDALYIRALFIPVSFFFLALEEGIEISSQVVSARRRGADAGDDSQPPLVRIGAIALGCFAVAAAVIALAAPQMAETLDVDAASHDDFVLFARLVAASFLLAVLTSVVAGTLRGWGSARSASVITIAVAGMQVLGVWLLGFYADMGVFAVPASIAGASVVGLTSGLVLLARTGLLRFGGPAEPPRQTVGILVTVGVPVAVSYLFIAGDELHLAVGALGLRLRRRGRLRRRARRPGAVPVARDRARLGRRHHHEPVPRSGREPPAAAGPARGRAVRADGVRGPGRRRFRARRAARQADERRRRRRPRSPTTT